MFGLTPLATRVIGGLLLAFVLIGTGARLAHIWYAPQLAGAKAQVAAAATQSKAVKAAQAAITRIDQPAEEKAQAQIIEHTKVIIRKVPVYVSASPSPPVGCVTNGMLRLHDAAVLNIDPADLRPPAGQPDAACSTTSPADFMAAIANNYSTALSNAEQLDSLEADVTSRIEAAASGPK